VARQRCKRLPVTIELKDYQKLDGTFDRIVSAGMFEHVSAAHYRTYIKMIRRCLAPDPEGFFLLHKSCEHRQVKIL
jgi:cyclopropane-fatty-acyl-phospholipid synthase